MGKRHNIRNEIKPKEPLKKIINFFKIIEESSKKSRLNYFFQAVNFCLALGVLLIIMPNLIDSFLDRWENITIFYLYLPKVGFSVLFYFISWIVGSIFNFSWSMFFQTTFKFTIRILLGLLLILILIYYKFIITVYIKIKKDLNYILYEYTK